MLLLDKKGYCVSIVLNVAWLKDKSLFVKKLLGIMIGPPSSNYNIQRIYLFYVLWFLSGNGTTSNTTKLFYFLFLRTCYFLFRNKNIINNI